MTVPILVIVGIDLRADGHAVRLPLEHLSYLNQDTSRDIRAGQSPPFDQPRAQGIFGAVAWRSSDDVAAKAA